MKILVVDDERSLGSLLGRAIKKLGHRAQVASHPADALALLGSDEFDAVITDIDMPEMNGVELATAIRSRRADMPIAFCTGSAPEDSVLHAAAQLGRVLPKVWTVADVRALVAELEQLRLARGSGRRLGAGVAAQADTVDRRRGAAEAGDTRGAARAPRRRLRLSLKTWEDVANLCDRQATEKPEVILRGSNPVERGDRVNVALTLPDELALSIGAEVVAVSGDTSRGKFVFSVRLTELTPEICTRLRSMCQAAGVRSRRRGSYRSIPRPGSDGVTQSRRAPERNVIGDLRKPRRGR